MTVKLTIELSDDVLETLHETGNLQIRLTSGDSRPAATKAQPPRAGSLPARILEWAEKRGKPFRTADVVQRFELTRAHAGMALSKLASGTHPIERQQRGVYLYRTR